jgi:hypothetical protein
MFETGEPAVYMKVFPHGQGDGGGPTHYLVRPDYPGRGELPPEVLRGDVEMTRDLIDSLDTKWKFTAGVLSWHPDDTVTPEQEQRVMDDFERVAFAGLGPDQRNILWVRHSHAGHHELHFVIPRVELSGGKAFNPCPPGWQKHFDVFRDLHNHRESWARPDDPARARVHTPDHADLHNSRLLRWGKTPSKDDRAAAKEAVHDYMRAGIEQGLVRNRDDVLRALTEAGLEINRAGKEYVTVKDLESGEKLRLKGGIYAEHWNIADFTGRARPGQDREGDPGNRNPDPETIRELEQELGRVIEKRAQFNRKRYPQKYRGIGTEYQFPLSDLEPGFRPEILAGLDIERRHLAGDGTDRLGADSIVSASDHGPAAEDHRAFGAERNFGSGDRQNMGHLQGLGAVSGGRQGLFVDARRLDDPGGGNTRKTGSMGSNEEISHDRTGTDTQRYLGPHGTGNGCHTESPRQGSGRSSATAGGSGESIGTAAEPHSANEQRFAGIDAAIARIKRYVHELGTALVALERHVERQIERARERSRGPGMRM